MKEENENEMVSWCDKQWYQRDDGSRSFIKYIWTPKIQYEVSR